ncbi:MAG: hypothetical protein RL616_859 [Verrucomicrobiota bacterium]|jgi:hypothetical protein
MIKKSLSAIALTLLLGATPTQATQTVRELWDGPNAKFALDGAVSNGLSSIGFAPNAVWVTSPPTNTSLRFDGSWNLDWMIGNGDTLLPCTVGNGGTLAYYPSEGNMQSSLINPATGLPYGNYYSQCYASRALATNSYIDLNANGTYYFSVRFVGGTGWSWWTGDMAGGIGFAAGNATNADFVGAGWTRVTPFLMEDGVTDAGSTPYVTTGTLDQAGVVSHPDDSGGVYYPRAAGTAGQLLSGGPGFILVGKLTTSVGGAATISVKTYPGYNSPAADPSSITWDATYSFTDTNLMTQLLLWNYGTGPSVQDAVRVGTDYGSAVGLEIVGAPNASPGTTVYAGTPVTFSTTYVGLNSGTYPMTFQWLSNSVPLTDATNATIVLTGTTTNFTANYSLAAANSFGTTTSAVTHLTVNPAAPVTIVQQPVSTTRYVGSPSASFTVSVDGTPPFTYQWQHAGTNIQSAVTTSAQANTVVLPPIALADAGNYSVTITNLFRTTNSTVVTLTEIVPATNSYAGVLTALSPYGYWRLDDSAPVIYDYFGNNNGQVLDASRMTFGDAGAPLVGFPANHQALTIGSQGNWWEPYRLNLPVSYFTNTMTFTMWVKGGCGLMSRNGYGNAYGIENNSGHLQFDWGGVASWDSGLSVPANTWTFVALVVEPTQATIYMGTDSFTLTSAQQTGLTISDSTTLGDTTHLTPLCVGRNPFPWAEDGGGAPWASMNGTWSDVSVFYQSLTPTQIQKLYLAGVGLTVGGTSDGSGNLILNWFSGATLQQASSLTGTWTDVSGSPTPPYSVPMTGAQKFYRVRN